ncbi:5-(carboxyamino)imidazole ribonucleotide mutase [Sporanaerobium hydrogeniformans]|uniref:5-(Carboxyamino)imidazole ribonucleotide mutase n=1 Tax=Sporanaerobium hydrogeniformans TaxID=3072179 RepID=A0AC61DHN2_9FIRM|nr:5-(carboxyamino)imidazole ribonucleotide mutase [Sporanaerobium hydrogeniformans]PHV72278.1 5-(carboxyamino)imidazole ribonucleotide mutase [Sporanaerobium hydrogeniformans]
MKVAFVMGSDSDLPVVERGVKTVKDFGVEVEVRVISAHRTPQVAEAFAKQAEQNGIGVIIAAAGKAAHLGGVLAAYTTLPVIGLPIKSSTLDGLDSLLSIVQMPPGIPVATVAIDGAENAGILAVQILATANNELKEKLKMYKVEMAKKVEEKDKAVREKFI